MVRQKAAQRAELLHRHAEQLRKQQTFEEEDGGGEGDTERTITTIHIEPDPTALIPDPADLTASVSLEKMGIGSGMRMTERLLIREGLMTYSPMETMRFIGYSLWRSIFEKKIDKMKHMDNVYFSLLDNNFAWLRNSKRPSAHSSSVGGAASLPSANAKDAANQGHTLIVAPGFTADGQLLTAEGMAKLSEQAKEQSSSEFPNAQEILAFTVGILRGVVAVLLGPHTPVVVTSQVLGPSNEVQFIVDFRPR